MCLHPIRPDETLIRGLRVLLTLVLISGSQAGFCEPAADDDRDSSPAGLERPYILHLSEKHQKLGGIVTQMVEATDYLPETRAFGQVVSPAPLFELRQRWQAAVSERKVAAAQLAAARSAFRQVQDLFNDQAVARFKLEQSRMEWIGAGARYEQAGSRLEAVRAAAVDHWGRVLAGWIMDPDSSGLNDLIRRKSVLLSVSLRPGDSLPEGTRTVFIQRGPDRSRARPAELISSAPVVGERSQGESYFFQTTAEDALRSGAHLYVWVPMPGRTQRRVEIPTAALVWRDGMPWIYLKIASDTFKRCAVKNAPDQSDRWFIPEIPDQNAEIVVLGGQTLLSQEFHWQIPDEGDD